MHRISLAAAIIAATLIAATIIAATSSSAWAVGSQQHACVRDALRVCDGPAATIVRHRTHLAHVARRPFRGAYHIPRFDQAEAEAEVHTQYRYRTPYLPYWVFP